MEMPPTRRPVPGVHAFVVGVFATPIAALALIAALLGSAAWLAAGFGVVLAVCVVIVATGLAQMALHTAIVR